MIFNIDLKEFTIDLVEIGFFYAVNDLLGLNINLIVSEDFSDRIKYYKNVYFEFDIAVINLHRKYEFEKDINNGISYYLTNKKSAEKLEYKQVLYFDYINENHLLNKVNEILETSKAFI